LPTPFELTGDPRWDEGGDLLKLYDLELDKRTSVRSVFTGVNPVFTPAINTVGEDEIVNMIEYSGDEPDGVKVLREISGGEGNNLKVATPEPVEEDSQKLQSGNGQEKSGSHTLDGFLQGFDGALL
jgi:hypothetical protein